MFTTLRLQCCNVSQLHYYTEATNYDTTKYRGLPWPGQPVNVEQSPIQSRRIDLISIGFISSKQCFGMFSLSSHSAFDRFPFLVCFNNRQLSIISHIEFWGTSSDQRFVQQSTTPRPSFESIWTHGKQNKTRPSLSKKQFNMRSGLSLRQCQTFRSASAIPVPNQHLQNIAIAREVVDIYETVAQVGGRLDYFLFYGHHGLLFGSRILRNIGLL